MRYLCPALALIAAIAITSCDSSKTDNAGLPATLALDKNIAAESSAPIAVADLSYVQLANDTTDALFKSAKILDVVGDTVVLIEDNPMVSRLIMFSLSDGHYIGQINHQGQGPGEYSRILGAFVDGTAGTVLLPDFHTPNVNVYALASDSLVEVISREFIPTVIPPSGGTETCINVVRPTPEGLDIVQFDCQFAKVDSITVPGFVGGNFSTVWTNSGTEGIFMIGDTIYTLTPGTLNPLAIIPRGDKAVTPEAEGELMMKLYSGGSEIELLKPYILIRDIQHTGDKMLITTMHDAAKHSDLYDLRSGELLYRNSYSELAKPSVVIVESNRQQALPVERLFAKNGVWYGIVSEETAAEISGTPSADTNCALVTFRL